MKVIVWVDVKSCSHAYPMTINHVAIANTFTKHGRFCGGTNSGIGVYTTSTIEGFSPVSIPKCPLCHRLLDTAWIRR